MMNSIAEKIPIFFFSNPRFTKRTTLRVLIRQPYLLSPGVRAGRKLKKSIITFSHGQKWLLAAWWGGDDSGERVRSVKER